MCDKKLTFIETRPFTKDDYDALYKDVTEVIPVNECFMTKYSETNVHFYCQKENHVLHVNNTSLVNKLDIRQLTYELQVQPELYTKITLKEFDDVLNETLTGFFQ